jgi:uncharacterized protein YacL (UPF0231 family)
MLVIMWCVNIGFQSSTVHNNFTLAYTCLLHHFAFVCSMNMEHTVLTRLMYQFVKHKSYLFGNKLIYKIIVFVKRLIIWMKVFETYGTSCLLYLKNENLSITANTLHVRISQSSRSFTCNMGWYVYYY